MRDVSCAHLATVAKATAYFIYFASCSFSGGCFYFHFSRIILNLKSIANSANSNNRVRSLYTICRYWFLLRHRQKKTNTIRSIWIDKQLMLTVCACVVCVCERIHLPNMFKLRWLDCSKFHVMTTFFHAISNTHDTTSSITFYVKVQKSTKKTNNNNTRKEINK